MKFLRYDLIETARDTTKISRVTGSFYGNSTINYCSILLQLWTSCIQGTVTVNFYRRKLILWSKMLIVNLIEMLLTLHMQKNWLEFKALWTTIHLLIWKIFQMYFNECFLLDYTLLQSQWQQYVIISEHVRNEGH